jgi:hypothetical protein
LLRTRWLVLPCLLILIVPLIVSADPTVEKIPLAPHGGALYYNGGAMPLSPTVLIVGTLGADDTKATADDKLLVVSDLGGTPTVESRVVGYLADSGGRLARLSATRAVYQSAGADGNWATGDETLVVMDRAGSGNVVTQVVVGSLQQNQGGSHVPVRLTPSSIVLAVLGADLLPNTADDVMVLVTGLGATPEVTLLPAPHLHISGRTQAVALSPRSFLVASTGPDGESSTDDDLLYLFTDVGGANARVDIPLPNLHYGRPGCPVRVSVTRAVAISEGPDGKPETADDRVYVLSGLGTTNAVTSVNVPYLSDYGAGRPCVLASDLVATPTWGPDGTEQTADDTIALISGLGTTNDVVQVTVGAMEEDRECRPVRLGPDRLAVVTFGPNIVEDTADDQLAFLVDAGTSNLVFHADVPGLAGWVANQPLALSTTALLVLGGGPDGKTYAGVDAVYTLVTSIGTGGPVKSEVPLAPGGSATRINYDSASAPALAGGGRAVALDPGVDGQWQTGGDDMIHVIEGLPLDRGVTVAKLQIKFSTAKPTKGESFKVQGTLTLDDPSLFAMGDLTVSIGNAAETIPADRIIENKGKYTYKAPKGGTGFITRLSYDSAKGKLSISGKGVGTGGETTAASYVPFTLEIEEGLFVGESITGVAGKSGIQYKAPK